jgi:hypothetical protein
MAKTSGADDRGDAADRPQDPLVARLRPDPSQPPEPTRTLEGVLGDSDRPGFRRLYVTPELDQYAEFRTDDVISVADIPPDQPPFLGEPATRVTLRRDAPVDFTRSHRARPLDEFDLDVRLAAAGRAALSISTFVDCPAETWEAECPGPTWGCDFTAGCGGETVQITICRGHTCIDVCDTRRTLCDDATCITCRTCNTCRTRCGQATCQTCNQATCQTCQTRCGQATCGTCRTQCGQDTCRTCETRCGTCNPHVFTCGNRCVEP